MSIFTNNKLIGKSNAIVGNAVLNESNEYDENFENFSKIHFTTLNNCWRIWGNVDISRIFSEISIQMQQENDIISAVNNTSNLSEKIVSHSNLSIEKIEQGDYKIAFKILSSLFDDFPFLLITNQENFIFFSTQILFFVTLHKGFLNASQSYLYQLFNLSSIDFNFFQNFTYKKNSSDSQKKNFTFPKKISQNFLNTLHCSALFHLKKKNFSDAAKILTNLVELCENDPQNFSLQIFFLIELSKLYIDQSNFVSALSPILLAVDLCEKRSFYKYLYFSNFLLLYIKFKLQHDLSSLSLVRSQLLDLIFRVKKSCSVLQVSYCYYLAALTFLPPQNSTKLDEETKKNYQGSHFSIFFFCFF